MKNDVGILGHVPRYVSLRPLRRASLGTAGVEVYPLSDWTGGGLCGPSLIDGTTGSHRSGARRSLPRALHMGGTL